jgi:transcriptional regulator GlxA family with amidase domain
MEPARSIDDPQGTASLRPMPLALCPPLHVHAGEKRAWNGVRAATAEHPAGGLSAHKLQRVIAYMNEHLAERVELRALAALAGLSQSHFCRAFKRSTGMPPYHFQLQVRVRRAQELLLTRAASLASIAVATGFADQAHFTRIFRQMIGLTPGSWQRARLG